VAVHLEVTGRFNVKKSLMLFHNTMM